MELSLSVAMIYDCTRRRLTGEKVDVKEKRKGLEEDVGSKSVTKSQILEYYCTVEPRFPFGAIHCTTAVYAYKKYLSCFVLPRHNPHTSSYRNC